MEMANRGPVEDFLLCSKRAVRHVNIPIVTQQFNSYYKHTEHYIIVEQCIAICKQYRVKLNKCDCKWLGDEVIILGTQPKCFNISVVYHKLTNLQDELSDDDDRVDLDIELIYRLISVAQTKDPSLEKCSQWYGNICGLVAKKSTGIGNPLDNVADNDNIFASIFQSMKPTLMDALKDMQLPPPDGVIISDVTWNKMQQGADKMKTTLEDIEDTFD
jgi:hypothetical protein